MHNKLLLYQFIQLINKLMDIFRSLIRSISIVIHDFFLLWDTLYLPKYTRESVFKYWKTRNFQQQKKKYVLLHTMFTFFAIFRRLHIQTLHTLCICIWLGLIWFNLIWFFKLYSLLTANVFLCFVSWVDCIDFSVLSSCYSCYVNYRIYICLNKVLYLWNLLLTPPHPSLLIILRIGQSLNNLLLWKHFGQFLLYKQISEGRKLCSYFRSTEPTKVYEP